jgi:hypothetical protein
MLGYLLKVLVPNHELTHVGVHFHLQAQLLGQLAHLRKAFPVYTHVRYAIYPWIATVIQR